MRKIIATALVLAVFMGSLPLTAQAQPSVSAASAVLYEPSSGTVLYEKNAHEARPMASTTKLMTALVGIEAMAEDAPVTVAEKAVYVEGSSLGLKAGDTLLFRDLLTGMLLASGNDAANAVALAVSADAEQFAQRMNAKAKELGMNESRFVTPSGLDAEGHCATAYDMALLGAAVMAQPTLREICAQKTAQIPVIQPSRTLYVKNHNRLLSLYEYAVGLKTGFTKKAGRCLVSAAEKDGVTLIAVTLGAPDDWNDHIALYEYGFSQVAVCPLPRVEVGDLAVSGGERASVPLAWIAPDPPVLPKERHTELRAQVRLPAFVLAPVERGVALGFVDYYVGDDWWCSVPITAAVKAEALPPKPFWTRMWEMFYTLIQGVCC